MLGHSNCGAIKGAVDKVKLGNITALLKNFEPALKAVGKSVGNKFRGMNDFAPCQVPTPAQCIGNADCWLHDAWGNGMAPAPYAGGKLKPVSLESLGASVLPTYVGYLLDDKLQCK